MFLWSIRTVQQIILIILLFSVMNIQTKIPSFGSKWHVGWSAPIYLPDYKLFLCTNPKCACTTLRKMCLNMVGVTNFTTHSQIHSAIFPASRVTHPIIPASQFKVVRNYSLAVSLFNDDNIMKASFVRDPVDRFVSGYLNRIFQENADFSLERPMLMIGLRKLLYHLHVYVDQYRSESQLIKIFINEVNIVSYALTPPEFPEPISDNIIDITRKAEKALKLIKTNRPNDTRFIDSHALDYVDEHFHPLAARCGHRYFRFDFIGKVESFDDDLSHMFVELNRSDLISRYIVNLNDTKLHQKAVLNPSDVDISHWVTDQLTELDLRLIKLLYKEDYALFDYI